MAELLDSWTPGLLCRPHAAYTTAGPAPESLRLRHRRAARDAFPIQAVGIRDHQVVLLDLAIEFGDRVVMLPHAPVERPRSILQLRQRRIGRVTLRFRRPA